MHASRQFVSRTAIAIGFSFASATVVEACLAQPISPRSYRLAEFAADPPERLALVLGTEGDGLGSRTLAGVDVVWVTEAYGYDAATMMGFLAGRTERIQIGAGILNVFSRTPSLLKRTHLPSREQ